MFEFKILKRSKKSRARLGVIKTPHGEIETPAFIPVATRATVRTLSSDEVEAVQSPALICNTYHLHTTPGEKIVKKAGGLHKFMNWNKPLMTDSGGFQVFSLGFGSDHGMGKILKNKQDKTLAEGTQPQKVKITEDGVHFQSFVDGSWLFLGPKESVKIQEALGADIMFAFDECPSPLADEKYMLESLEKTHRWARVCLDARTSKQALYGIVQGGAFKHLRTKSARLIGALPFEGFGIGGEFGYNKQSLKRMISQVTDELPENKPKHVLGVGHPEDFEIVALAGGDTFDCIAPTHYARRGTVFTSQGKLNLNKKTLALLDKPLDPKCKCDVCVSYSRGYISHLIRSQEITGMKLASYHNLYFFNNLAKEVRRRIKNDEL
ncbi:MAG: tRNA guanosine(34) transglycosylase Tgt [Patescibacteria group bacterium]|nr:tRNA guanosine(34) transglycosylase Tgt [bacterium]MDZ4240573.1 tRNA guanosine(34) transglycosylase Tgt [Patescibacteria group bacterium]